MLRRLAGIAVLVGLGACAAGGEPAPAAAQATPPGSARVYIHGQVNAAVGTSSAR